MATHIHTFTHPIRASDGHSYRVRAEGEMQADGAWTGWLVFESEAGRTLRTDVETTQSNLDALVYWAAGLEPVYLEGALARTTPDA